MHANAIASTFCKIRENNSLDHSHACDYDSAMTPKDAIQKLLSRKWTVDQIADASDIHRASVYRILNGQSTTYDTAIKLLAIAKGRPVPPKETKS